VVRVTNRDIITQIVAADLTHDVVLAAAYAHELPRYGIKARATLAHQQRGCSSDAATAASSKLRL